MMKFLRKFCLLPGYNITAGRWEQLPPMLERRVSPPLDGPAEDFVWTTNKLSMINFEFQLSNYDWLIDYLIWFGLIWLIKDGLQNRRCNQQHWRSSRLGRALWPWENSPPFQGLWNPLECVCTSYVCLNPQKAAQFGSRSERLARFLDMLQVTVALPSGRSEKFSVLQSSKVGDLRVLAQKSFQLGFLRLVAADHSLVDPTKSLQAAGLQDGGRLAAVAVEAKIATTAEAFALFCSGGDRVVTWGSSLRGGDSSKVQDQLKRCPAASSNGECICCESILRFSPLSFFSLSVIRLRTCWKIGMAHLKTPRAQKLIHTHVTVPYPHRLIRPPLRWPTPKT